MPSKGSRERAAERRTVVFDLRKQGVPIRSIAAQVGVSHTQVRRDLAYLLNELTPTYDELRGFRHVLDGGLDAIKLSAFARMAKGGADYVAAGRLALHTIYRQAQLWGYHNDGGPRVDIRDRIYEIADRYGMDYQAALDSAEATLREMRTQQGPVRRLGRSY